MFVEAEQHQLRGGAIRQLNTVSSPVSRISSPNKKHAISNLHVIVEAWVTQVSAEVVNRCLCDQHT
jgi:hypothetical protein